jgi:transaldolase
MSDNPLLAAKALGQHIWLDNLTRPLLHEGGLQRLIKEDGIDGITSNPAIFEKAIAKRSDYQAELDTLWQQGLSAEACYETLVIADIRAASDLLQPRYEASRGETGYVSLEVSPALANDTAGSIAAAHRLQLAVGRDNVLIKLPATPAGIAAFEQLTGIGLRVNVTLIFSLAQYEAVAHAYLRGAQTWLNGGGAAAQLRSVASVFLSRVDTRVDQRLDNLATASSNELKGQAGIALAKCCYGRYQSIFHGPAFAALRQSAVAPQWPLWASTGSKSKSYRDVHYVEALIGPESITTLPDATLDAFRAHGQATLQLTKGLTEAHLHDEALLALGIDLRELGESLQTDGIRLFAEAYAKIMHLLKNPRKA